MPNPISASAKGASYLIALQISSRAFTFLINQIILRYSSPERLGLSAQLELYTITVLYFARESIRVAVQRQTEKTQVIVNLSYISLVLGLPLSVGLGYAFLMRTVEGVPFVREALGVCAVSCVVELLSEPAFVVTQQRLLYGIRASAETTATILSCVFRLLVVVGSNKAGMDVGVMSFAFGHLIYALSLVVMYNFQIWPMAKKDKFSLLLTKLTNTKDVLLGYFSSALLKLSLSLFLQNSFKYILTQGDGLLIAALASLRDQGAYALASNYGGLIARMLFQPIEETSRNLFAQLCASDPADKVKQLQNREKSQQKDSKQHSAMLLQDLLKLYALVSLVSFSIGPIVAPILLRIIAGSRWADTEASDVLAIYCYYIPLLAVNGVTESFVAATASNEDLYYQSLFMGAFFAGFAGSAYFFLKVLRLGAQGLVWSNCVNMALRILFNVRFVKSFFGRNEINFELQAAIPSTISIALSIAVAAILRAPRVSVAGKGFMGELLQVGTISGAYAIFLLFLERQYLKHCYNFLKPSKSINTAEQKKEKARKDVKKDK